MDSQHGIPVAEVARDFDAAVRALAVRNTASVRAVRRDFSRMLSGAVTHYILDLAYLLMEQYGHRWPAYELIASHSEAFSAIGAAELKHLGQGMDSWWSGDAFARVLSGPAWLRGQIPDSLMRQWAQSNNRWWRRAALVSTVALNVRSLGGTGEVARTLQICRMLVEDRDNMVVKALSWALRQLVVHDPGELEAFLVEHESVLASRVKREVRNKLEKGLKNPKPTCP